MIKGEERYIFQYDSANRKTLLRVFESFADNPELSFNWEHAYALTNRVLERDDDG